MINRAWVEQITGENEADERITEGLPIPFRMYIHVCWLLQDTDVVDAALLAHAGAYIANMKRLTRQQSENITGFFEELYNQSTSEQWKTKEDPLLSVSYHLLRGKQITYAQAAEFAAWVLEKPIKTDTWKDRVMRWADRRGLPKIGQRKPRGSS